MRSLVLKGTAGVWRHRRPDETMNRTQPVRVTGRHDPYLPRGVQELAFVANAPLSQTPLCRKRPFVAMTVSWSDRFPTTRCGRQPAPTSRRSNTDHQPASPGAPGEHPQRRAPPNRGDQRYRGTLRRRLMDASRNNVAARLSDTPVARIGLAAATVSYQFC